MKRFTRVGALALALLSVLMLGPQAQSASSGQWREDVSAMFSVAPYTGTTDAVAFESMVQAQSLRNKALIQVFQADVFCADGSTAGVIEFGWVIHNSSLPETFAAWDSAQVAGGQVLANGNHRFVLTRTNDTSFQGSVDGQVYVTFPMPCSTDRWGGPGLGLELHNDNANKPFNFKPVTATKVLEVEHAGVWYDPDQGFRGGFYNSTPLFYGINGKLQDPTLGPNQARWSTTATPSTGELIQLW